MALAVVKNSLYLTHLTVKGTKRWQSCASRK